MANQATIARPYAEAIFKVAGGAATDKWIYFLSILVFVLADQSFVKILRNPNFGKKKITNLLVSLIEASIELKKNRGSIFNFRGRKLKSFTDFELTDGMKNFVGLLVFSHRLDVASSILDSLFTLMSCYDKTYRAEIRTAFPLSEQQVSELCELIEKKIGKRCFPEIVLDKCLLGGVKLSVDNVVFDFSLKEHLRQLKLQLNI